MTSACFVFYDAFCSKSATLNAGKNNGWTKKVSYYQELSLNIIKTVIMARYFINFVYKMSRKI